MHSTAILIAKRVQSLFCYSLAVNQNFCLNEIVMSTSLTNRGFCQKRDRGS